jgi:hypothetical protein
MIMGVCLSSRKETTTTSFLKRSLSHTLLTFVYLSFYLNNSGGRAEPKLGTLEKDVATVASHEWGAQDNVLRLDGSESMDRGQQVLDAVVSRRQHDILEQRCNSWISCGTLMHERYLA